MFGRICSAPRRQAIRRPRAHTSSARTAQRLSIIVADDHPIMLAGLDALFARESDFIVLARCADGHEALRAVAAYRPDILVVDQDMPGIDGPAIVKQLRQSGKETPVLLLARTDTHRLGEVLRLGVEGVIYNVSPQVLIRCIREIYVGRRWPDPGLNGHASQRPGHVPALDVLTSTADRGRPGGGRAG